MAWSEIRARAEQIGRPMAMIDGLLATTAEAHGLTLVTRNTRDFAIWVGEIVDPWD